MQFVCRTTTAHGDASVTAQKPSQVTSINAFQNLVCSHRTFCSVMTSVRRTGRRRRKLDSGPLRVPPEIPPVTSCSANSVSRTGGQQNFKEKKRAHRKEKRADLGRGFGVPREPLAPDADLLTSWPEVSNDERKCSKVSLRLDSSVEFLDQTTGNASSPPVLNERKKGDTRENYLERAEKRLKGSRFRMLNEKLYTSTADEAMDMFSEDPVAYVEYHDGYRESQNLWPEKPVDGLIQWLKKRYVCSIKGNDSKEDCCVLECLPSLPRNK